MKLDKEMVIIDTEIKDNIFSCVFDVKSNRYIIKYNNSNKSYYYSTLVLDFSKVCHCMS